jgi:hypothetical protein
VILYKYVPFESGRKILDTNSIGFSQPKYFNDPFDMPSYPVNSHVEPVGEWARKAYIEHELRMMGLNSAWAESSGILCLTRTPTNPLMWAHYAQSHKGLVLGIDMVMAGCTDEDRNIIPAQYGSVVYVSRRSQQPFLTAPKSVISIGETRNFLSDQYERLQRLFLHKPICWSYEEEVRVVKSIDGISETNNKTQSGTFNIVNLGDRTLYTLSLLPGCIRELYFGIRSDDEEADALYYAAKEAHPKLTVYECSLDANAQSVGYRNYITLADASKDGS